LTTSCYRKDVHYHTGLECEEPPAHLIHLTVPAPSTSEILDRNKLTAVILAGGRGSRVDGVDKGLIHWNGKPLIQHVCDRIGPQVQSTLISCNRNALEYEKYADRVITDLRPGYLGPLAGLESASHHVNTEFVLVVCCDTPRVPSDLAEKLAQPLQNDDMTAPEISFAHDSERGHYLCSVVRARTLTTLSSYLDNNGRSVRGWHEQHRVISVDFSNQAAAFNNFNDWGAFTSQ
jgi:molybdenum cofactor guanylyltransferase